MKNLSSILLTVFSCFFSLVTSKGQFIEQNANVYLLVSPNNRDVYGEAGSTTFNVSSNVNWEAHDNAGWCQISPEVGSGNATINVTFMVNPTGLPRFANIQIIGGGITEIVTLAQYTSFGAICPPKMISYWKLDESWSMLQEYHDYVCTNDASGVAIAPGLGPVPVVGRVGGAQQFDGVSAGIIVYGPHNRYDFAANSSFTFESWVKHPEPNNGEEIIVERKAVNNGHAINLKFNSPKATFSVRSVTGELFSVTGVKNLFDDQWHHIVGVKDGDLNQLRIYVDGVLENTVSANYTSGFSSTAGLCIGFRQTTVNKFFKGAIDEVAIHHDALDASIIMQHYNNGLQNMGYCSGQPSETAPIITSTPITNGLVNQLYSYDVNAIGNPTPKYALITFPSGMTINSSNGVIQWTPTATGNYNVTVLAANGISPDAIQSFIINVLVPVPNAPTNLLANKINSKSIGLIWQDNSATETNYIIERRTGIGGTWSELAQVGANITNYTDNNLDASTEYCYRVQAYNTDFGTYSDYSNESCATTDPTDQTCPTTMISYWKLDESSGSVFDDYVGPKNAESINLPLCVAGRVGFARQFNGTSNNINAPRVPAYDFTANTSFSLEAWINHPTSASSEEIIVERKSTGALAINLKLNSSNVAIFSVRNDASQIFSVTGTKRLDDGNWHHVVGVRDAITNQLKIYVDEVLENTVSALFTAGFTSTSEGISIGWRKTTNNKFFKGTIDEVAIYNSALDVESITQHYNNGLQGKGYCGPQPCPGIATVDYGVKTYHTVQIGDQCWLTENISIGYIINGNRNQTNDGRIETYCSDNNWINCETYGGLYQWDEAMQYVNTEGARGICPEGWHIPTNAEFQVLSNAVGSNGNALKAIGQGTGSGAGTNTSGFSALFAGTRNPNGNFYGLGTDANFWSSTECTAPYAYYINLNHEISEVYLSYFGKNDGLSVRCVKDVADKYLSVIPEHPFAVTRFSGSKKFSVISNVRWEVLDDADWCQIDPNTGTENGTITATFTANLGTSDRIATITVIGGGITRTVILAQSHVCCNCPPTMISYWKLNETLASLGEYHDYVGFSDGQSIDHEPMPVTGIVGGAQQFNGSSDKIKTFAENDFNFSTNSSFTFEAWIKPDLSTSVAEQIIMERKPTNSNLAINLKLKSTQIIFLVRNTAGQLYSAEATKNVYDNNWHHIVGVKDGSSKQLRLYVDGVLVKTVATTYTSGFISPTPLGITIGYRNKTGDESYFKGAIDEVAIYNSALSAALITQHYNNGLQGKGYCQTTLAKISLSSKDIFSSLENHVNGSTVQLNWETASDLGEGKFEIERMTSISDGTKDWQKIGEINLINGSESNSYVYNDNPNTSGKFSYRIKFAIDGEEIYSEEIEAEVLPTDYALYQNYPNPFNPVTTIKFGLPIASKTTLVIYTMLGEKVIELINENKEAGTYDVQFDASNISSGTYIYRLTANDFVKTKKMTVLK